MGQWLVQWTAYCQRIQEAPDAETAIEEALKLGPEEEVLDSTEPPEARPLPG